MENVLHFDLEIARKNYTKTVYGSWFPGDWKDLFNDSNKVKEKIGAILKTDNSMVNLGHCYDNTKPYNFFLPFFPPVCVFMCVCVCVCFILLQICYFIVHKILLIMVQFNFVLETFFKPFIYPLEIRRLR